MIFGVFTSKSHYSAKFHRSRSPEPSISSFHSAIGRFSSLETPDRKIQKAKCYRLSVLKLSLRVTFDNLRITSVRRVDFGSPPKKIIEAALQRMLVNFIVFFPLQQQADCNPKSQLN